MAQHNVTGVRGEDIAETYLREKNYKILHRNWSYLKNEIDIIASDSDTIIFVEVKTRTSCQWGRPEDAISEQKIRRIANAANYYMQEHSDLESARFDVVSIILDGDSVKIEHIEDAFFAPLN